MTGEPSKVSSPPIGDNGRYARWLLLDIGGVLEIVDDKSRAGSFAARWAPTFGLTEREFSRRMADADLPDVTRQTGVADAYWQGIGDALQAPSEKLAAMREDFWNEYCGLANEELISHLASARGQAGLAILSNSGDGAREEEERRYGFSKLFDPICYSHEIGVTKPDPAAFNTALQLMGASPSSVLFIDDVDENVTAARKLGIRSHLHLDTRCTIDAIDRFIEYGADLPGSPGQRSSGVSGPALRRRNR